MFGATRVFADKGFRNTSVEDLLEAGQVSRRTFYRFFTSKDDVALALYSMGTTTLVETIRRRVAAESDAREQLEACVDSHLANARSVGRLVFVLGGEAQSLESPLHAHRMAAHDQVVQLLRAGNEVVRDADPLVVRALVIALEQCVRIVLQDSDEGRRVSEAAVKRARAAMMRIATGTFAGLLGEPTPMPRERD